MRDAPSEATAWRSWTAWMLELPPHTERTMRMESLIARLRLVVVAVNIVLLAFLLDTTGWNMRWAWSLVLVTLLYGLVVVSLQPYRHWRLFQTSLVTAFTDSIVIALFIGVTGGASSPFYLLYFLAAAAIAMRFDMRQALAACGLYTAMYGMVYLWTWDASANAFGELFMRCAYLFIMGVAVGHLAREESARSEQVEAFEKLTAEKEKLITKRERAARVDRLTGLNTRGSLEKDAMKALRKARSGDGYLSVMFCDIDRLKQINDELGHDAGDRVLRAAGHALKRGLRAQDLVGRYGGDEFVIVLPNVTRETAYERADHIILGIKQVNEMLPEDLHIGLSVGIATFPFDADDYGTLVKLADQAMYLAKRDGGNRVRTANDLRLFWEMLPKTA
jgi:diguanylate cyclase (GGDEF)-like protein